MEVSIIDYFDKIYEYTEEEKLELEKAEIRQYKKGDVILKAGQIAKECFFVHKGCIRQYYLIDGEEKTTNIFTEHHCISCADYSNDRIPSNYFLDCLEDTQVSISTPEMEERLYAKFPRFEKMCRLATEKNLSEQQKRMDLFLVQSPEERYLHLLETRPDLLLRIPQYHLASYLGMKPESLSRIKKRIMVKETK
jgi:CRP-like cAMP-binding protein